MLVFFTSLTPTIFSRFSWPIAVRKRGLKLSNQINTYLWTPEGFVTKKNKKLKGKEKLNIEMCL